VSGRDYKRRRDLNRDANLIDAAEVLLNRRFLSYNCPLMDCNAL
jgi:hypothetical protein